MGTDEGEGKAEGQSLGEAEEGQIDGADGCPIRRLHRCTADFLEVDLPALMEDDCVGIRSSAMCLWSHLHIPHISLLLLVGSRLESRGDLPLCVWTTRVLG